MLNKRIACLLKSEKIPAPDKIMRELYTAILSRPHISEHEFSHHEINAYKSALRSTGVAVDGVVKYKIDLINGVWTYLGRTNGVSNDSSDFEGGKVPQPDRKRNKDKIKVMQVLKGLKEGTLDIKDLREEDGWIKNGSIIGYVVESEEDEYAGRDALYIVQSTREEGVMEDSIEIAVFLGNGLHTACLRGDLKDGLCKVITDVKKTAEIARKKAGEEKRLKGVGSRLRHIALGTALVYKHEAAADEKFIDEESIPGEIRLLRAAHKKLLERISKSKERLEQDIRDLKELGHNTIELEENLGRLEGEEMLAQVMLTDGGESSLVPDEIKDSANGLEVIVRKTRRDVFSALKLRRKYLDWVIRKTERDLQAKGTPPEEIKRDHFIELYLMYINLLDNLEMELRKDAKEVKEGDIVIAKNLMNSVIMELVSHRVSGVAVEAGGEASHVLIAARGSRIPAVVGLTDIVNMVDTGQVIIIDSYTGEVIINPTRSTLREFEVRRMHYDMLNKAIDAEKGLPCRTLDGTSITIRANVERVDEVEISSGLGAKGVGLFRTEYLYMNRVNLPTEDELVEAFVKIAGEAFPNPVVIRTLDIGGDKAGEVFKLRGVSSDMNMMDYYRGKTVNASGQAVYSDEEEGPRIFRAQVRAILRASSISQNIKILFPMVSTIEEAEYLLRVVEEEKERLKRDLMDERIVLKAGQQLFDDNIEIGCMIETPEAVKNARGLAGKFKYFNVGTNDLTKLTYKVRRQDVSIDLQRTPQVLLQVKDVIEAANEFGIGVDVCGEMAGDLLSALVLIGLGVRELSMSPALIPYVMAVLRRVYINETQEIADIALRNIDPDSLRRRVFDLLSSRHNLTFDELSIFNLLL